VETLVYEPAFVPVWERRQYLLARPHGHNSGGAGAYSCVWSLLDKMHSLVIGIKS